MMTNKGFTIVEVLVAMAVFSVALLELGRMQLVATQVNAASGRLTRATALAQDRVEQLLNVAYDHAQLIDLTPAGQSTTHTEPNPPAGYAVTWRVDTDTPAVGMKTVNVTVGWQNLGRAKSFTLAFYKDSI